MEKITVKVLDDKGLFDDVHPNFIKAVEAAYFEADEYLRKFLKERDTFYWLSLFTVKNLYLKNIVFFNIEMVIKFIFVPKNKILFESYFIDNNKNLIKTANLISKKFAEAYQIKPYEDRHDFILKNERGDTDFFEYKIVNHSSELGLTIEEWLNANGREGWELVSVSNHSYFFKRKIINDFLHL